jgi:hypothetical protein
MDFLPNSAFKVQHSMVYIDLSQVEASSSVSEKKVSRLTKFCIALN